MNETGLDLLLVEDNPDDAELVIEELGQQTHCRVRIHRVDRLGAALDHLAAHRVDAVLLDLSLPDSSGVGSVEALVSAFPGLAVLVLTGNDSMDTARACMRAGAQAYLVKNELRGPMAVRSVMYSVERARSARELFLAQYSMEHADDLILWFDGDSRIQRANASAVATLGWDHDQLLGLRLLDLDLNLASEEWGRFWEGMKGSGSLVVDTRFRTRIGTTVPVEVTANHLTFGREELGCAICRDLTRRRELEARVRDSMRMEALSTLAGGIAHDFSNVLAAMMGYAELASLQMPDDSAGQRELEEVIAAGRRARELIQQIRAFARRHEQDPQALDLSGLVQESLKLLRPGIPTTVKIQTRTPDDLPPVFGEPAQIRQLIVDLVTNAFQAMEEETGSITISTEAVDGSEIPPQLRRGALQDAFVRLSVHDDGPTLDPEIAARFHEPFFTTGGDLGPRAIGLAAAHGTVVSHNGYTMVHSAPGQWNEFRVLLPVVGSATSAPREMVDVTRRGNGEHLLVVDDEAALTLLCRKILELHGYRVTVANESPAALALFEAGPEAFDLVLTDERMPDLTGHELAERIAAIRPGTPVLLTTGGGPGVEAAVRSSNVLEVITKPYTSASVIGAVERALESFRLGAGKPAE